MSRAHEVRTGTVRRSPASATAWAALVLLGSGACGRAAPAGEGPAPTEASTVFDLLEGAWAGEGSLFGRPAAFTMTWTPTGSRHRLDFTNGMVGDGGQITPILAAVAHYTARPDGTATAEWTDDRPQEISIQARVGDSLLVSDWTAPTESGRTEYRVAADGTVRVRDWVRSNSELRPFGEAVYRRR